MIKKFVIPGASIFLIMALILPSVSGILVDTTTQKTVQLSETWYVPDDFPTIQEAIDSDLVKDGDTIFVHPNEYKESVTITKSINLITGGFSGAIINAEGKANAITIRASNVVVQRFDIFNALNRGIYVVDGSQGVELTYNTVFNTKIGIEIYHSNGNTVNQNGFLDCSEHGILIDSSSYNTITGNGVLDNDNGIMLKSANSNTIGGDGVLANSITENNIGINIEKCVYYENALKEDNNFKDNVKDINGAKKSRDRVVNNFFLNLLEQFPLLQRLLKL